MVFHHDVVSIVARNGVGAIKRRYSLHAVYCSTLLRERELVSGVNSPPSEFLIESHSRSSDLQQWCLLNVPIHTYICFNTYVRDLRGVTG